MQRAAEANVATVAGSRSKHAARKRMQNRKPAKGPDAESDPLEAALVALDPTTGEVRAMVGGRDFKASRFNRATQALRQPGSAFKPFVYAAALEAGYSPSSLVTRPRRADSDTLQGAWIPEDEHSTAAAMTVRAALRTSSNRAAVRMLEEVGIAKTVDQARKMGMGNVPSVPSLALGSGEVTLMAMTSAYAAFADGGQLRSGHVHPPRRRRARAKVLFEATPSAEQVISPQTAFLMTSMLSDVVNYGTAYKARQEGFTLPAAGKTGTTNDYVDAWFVGFTPHLVTGVWIGFDKPRTIIANGFAGEMAVPHVGALHEAGDGEGQTRGVQGAVRVDGGQRLPRVGQAPGRVLRSRHHRVLRARHRADRSVSRSTTSINRWPTTRHCASGRRCPRDAAQFRTAPQAPRTPVDTPIRRLGISAHTDVVMASRPTEEPKEETRVLGPRLRARQGRRQGQREKRRQESNAAAQIGTSTSAYAVGCHSISA